MTLVKYVRTNDLLPPCEEVLVTICVVKCIPETEDMRIKGALMERGMQMRCINYNSTIVMVVHQNTNSEQFFL